MIDDDLIYASIETVGARLRDNSLSSEDLTKRLLARADASQESLHAFIAVTPEEATDAGQRADAELGSGRDRGPLHGIPVAVKDVFDLQGTATTAGTLAYANDVKNTDCTVVAKLRDAGAVILGKTNMDELAWGSTSGNPHYGQVANPWNLQHHPGGSSGGSAVAVAAGLAYAALGH